MGSGTSLPSRPFVNFVNWPVDRIREVIHQFKAKDYDFGLDTSAVSMLLGCDNHAARSVVEGLCRNETGVVNGLAMLAGFVLLNPGFTPEDAAQEVFNIFDFDTSKEIAMDEFSILLLSSARGLRVMLDVGVEPVDEQVEEVTFSAYRLLGKQLGADLTKSEFMDWVGKVFLEPAASAEPLTAIDVLRLMDLLEPAALPAGGGGGGAASDGQGGRAGLLASKDG